MKKLNWTQWRKQMKRCLSKDPKKRSSSNRPTPPRPSRAPFPYTIPGKRTRRTLSTRLVEIRKQVRLGATKSNPRLLCKSPKLSPIYTQKNDPGGLRQGRRQDQAVASELLYSSTKPEILKCSDLTSTAGRDNYGPPG
jgi:hypothetical protein